MGLSQNKSTQTQNQNTTQTGTTTPSNPLWVSDSLMDYTGRIGSMLDADPNSFVAGASPLQQQAWGSADRLGQWTGNSNAASNIAMNAANAPASTMPGAAGYTAARGNASTYTPATLANPREASATGYNSAQAGPASMLTGLDNYMSPYRDQVVNATLADYDHNAAQQQAALEAQGARNGAFGGSRFGVAQAELLGNQGRARATTEAGLRNDMFNTGAGLSQSDAANRQQAGLFNAGAQNEAGQFGASALNNASLANQGASNQFALTQAGMQNDAARYGADAANQFNESYLGRSDQAASQQAQATNAANLFNAQQQETGLNRQLTAANSLNGFGNDYAANTRADLGALSAMGGDQRAIEQAYQLAPLAQLQAGGSLFGATPFQLFNGQNINTTGTMNGTGTTTTTPSLFQMLMQGSQSAAQAYAGGAG